MQMIKCLNKIESKFFFELLYIILVFKFYFKFYNNKLFSRGRSLYLPSYSFFV